MMAENNDYINRISDKMYIFIQGQNIMYEGIICLGNSIKSFGKFHLKLIPPARVNLQNFNISCIYREH